MGRGGFSGARVRLSGLEGLKVDINTVASTPTGNAESVFGIDLGGWGEKIGGIFTDWAGGQAKLDLLKDYKKAGFNPYGETTFESGTSGTSANAGAYSDFDYKKAGLVIGVIGVLLTAYAVFRK
nr:hypothetical protein 8 [Moraxellaceae bacterium]